MSDPLSSILRRLEIEPPVLDSREFRSFDSHAELLVQLGVLAEITPVGTAACPECGIGPRRRVEYISDAKTSKTHGYINCPECGLVEIQVEKMRRWRIDISGFLSSVFSTAGVSGSASEILPGRLWRLGRVTWAERSREVYFARCYRRDDGQAFLAEMSHRPKAIVFVPTEVAASRWGAATENLVLALESTLTLNDQVIRLDVECIEGRLTDAGLVGVAKTQRPTRKRADRAANIEALRKAMVEHLQAARDHAYATKESTGTPNLLPRPTQKMLARLAAVSESDVSRCLNDSTANELRLLWETALDLDQIMTWKVPTGRRR